MTSVEGYYSCGHCGNHMYVELGDLTPSTIPFEQTCHHCDRDYTLTDSDRLDVVVSAMQEMQEHMQ